jgi:hypothetical protein
MRIRFENIRYVESTLSWKIHTHRTINKLSAACYAIRSLKSFMSHKTLKMVYYAYFHSIMNCVIIFWGNTPHNVNVFKIQKNIIKIITRCRSTVSHRDFFKTLKILTLQSQHIFSLLLFVANKESKFTMNSNIYNTNTRQKFNFHQPLITKKESTLLA